MVGLATVCVGGAHAATALSESFDDVAGLAGAGWTFVNNSTAPVGSTWFQGNSGIFESYAGAPDAYAAVNFLSTGSPSGAISNWMITPLLSLDSVSNVSFQVRNAGGGFVDTVEVRLSTSGTDVGSSTSSLGDFTTLVGAYASDTDGGWTGLDLSVPGLGGPTPAYLAFRYVVDDVSVNGNYLGIDTLTVTAVPEPASYVLMGLGLAALSLRRRT